MNSDLKLLINGQLINNLKDIPGQFLSQNLTNFDKD